MNPVIEALSLLTPFDIDRPKIRIGPNTDGGYIFVNDISAHQTIISYGIGREYRFDIEMAERGHDVYMFDHTIEAIQAENKKLHFFREGVAGRTDISQNLFSLKDHLHRHQIRGDRLILKMDIEGAEFDALGAVPDDTLDRFEQIVLEVHWLNNLVDLAFRDRFGRIFRRTQQRFHVVSCSCQQLGWTKRARHRSWHPRFHGFRAILCQIGKRSPPAVPNALSDRIGLP